MAMTTAVSPERSTLIKTICGTPSQNAALPKSSMIGRMLSPQSAGFKYCAIGPKPTLRPSTDYFVAGEELRDLLLRGVGGIRAMHRILADRSGQSLTDSARRGFRRIGRAHEIAIARDRVLTFENLDLSLIHI